MITHESTDLAIKAVPPLTVSSMGLFGIALPDLVLWATLIYTVLMIIRVIWKWSKEVINEKEG